MPAKEEAPNVYQLMSRVRGELAKEGIGKNQKNAQQGYKYRGIDDLYNAIAPILSRHGLIVSPTVLEREAIERTTAKGTLNMHVILTVRLRFIAADNPESQHETIVFGEGMDTGDKASNKALSTAMKYGVITEFTIPTVGEEDADASTPQESMSQAPSGVNPETGEVPPPRSRYVTEKEALDIELTVRRLGIDGPAFLKWCKAASYSEILRGKLPKIEAELAKREREAQGGDARDEAEQASADLPTREELDNDIPF